MTDREKLIAMMEEAYYCSIEELADHLLANGVVVREKGEWEKQELTGCEPFYECSVCRKIHDQDYNFCNNCGADMRKGENG